MKIVGIGGGDMRVGETAAIDRHIVELAAEARPRALFLPTASFDDPGYFEVFSEVYGDTLGCETSVLYLWEGYSAEEIEAGIQATKWNHTPHYWPFRGDLEQVRRSIESADLIYVGGGNTRRMVELWRSSGIDGMLRIAAENGTVLSGISAGCICWARYGNSDAALTEGLGRNTMRVDCLDFVPITLCPHMSREPFRLEEFKAMMKETPGIGIGIDDGCALEIVDTRYRLIAGIEGAVGHLVTADRYEVLESGEISILDF